MKIARALILIILSCLALFPLYWQLVGSFMDNTAVLKTPPPLLPIGGNIENYQIILERFAVGRWIWNSTVVCVATAGLRVSIAFLAAYAIEIKRFRGYRVVWAAFLGSMMLSGHLSLIPLYRLMRTLGLTTIRLGLILPSTLAVLYILIIGAYFRNFPRDTLDAAEIDGAGEGRKLVAIMVPMSIPVLAALGTMSVIGTWNDFFWQSLVANTPRNRTVVVGVARAVYDAVVFHQLGVDWVDYGLLMAGAMIVFLPMGLFFVFGCRYVMKGLFARRDA